MLREWIKKLVSLRDPKPKTLEEWAENHRGVVRKTLDTIDAWVPHAGVILDIGGNIGLFTEELHKRRPDCEFHVFEPVAQYFAKCEARFAGTAAVHLWPIALSDQNESRLIYKAKHNPGANSVVPEIMFDRRENSMVQPDTVVEEERIECARFSDWGPKHGIANLSFIKIDTEGFDYAVLRGLLDYLATCDPLPPILTELLNEGYHPFWKQQKQVIEDLVAIGYSAFPLEELPKVGDVLLIPAGMGESFILPEDPRG